jgi:hypothetical protein
MASATNQRIDKLSREQLEALPAIRDDWLSVGLQTGAADRPRAEEGVREAYRAAGLEPPPIVIWLESPLRGSIATAMLLAAPDQVRGQVGDQVRDQVWGQVRDQVRSQVWDQVRDQVGSQVGDQVRDQVRSQVWDQVRDQVGSQVWDQVGSQVWDQVRGQVWDQVRDQVRGQVRDQVWDQVRGQVWDQVRGQVRGQVRDQVYYAACYGQHDAAWLAFYDTFGRFGLKAVERLAGHMLTARSAGWWFPFRGAVVMTERPVALHRDEQHRLHRADGPAIVYPDGWGVYAWHGRRVPEQVITAPHTLDPQHITQEGTAEVRRLMIERYGADKYIRVSGAKLVNRDDWGELYRQELPGDEPLVMLHCVNATAEGRWVGDVFTPDLSLTGELYFRDFWLRVPPTMRTAHEAAAWTFDKEAAEYGPSIQT